MPVLHAPMLLPLPNAAIGIIANRLCHHVQDATQATKYWRHTHTHTHTHCEHTCVALRAQPATPHDANSRSVTHGV